MILYLLKSTLCMTIFLLVYLLLLEKEKMHRFNRWYLLGSIVCSFAVPLISFRTEAQALPVLEDIQIKYIEWINADNIIPVQSSIPSQSRTINWENILLISYCIISIGLLARFSRNIYLLFSRIAKNKVLRYGVAKLVLLKENVVSHTFLNYIFISETEYVEQKLEKEILIHELTHVQQKHSLDILFVEFLQAVFWFNPLFYFYKKTIQLNHEFLADDAVLKNGSSIPAYQYLLLEKLSLGNNALLSSSFNFSVTKKRLVMMTKHYNPLRIFIKQLLIVPLILSLVFFLGTTSSFAKIQHAVLNDKYDKKDTSVIKPAAGIVKLLSDVPYTKEGVSKQLMEKYFTLEDKYLNLSSRDSISKKRFTFFEKLTPEDRNRLETIFIKMNREQQATTHIVFMPPMKPFKKEIPTEEQYNNWKDASKYGIWINNKRVNNNELNKFSASDFAHYYASKLSKNAINYGKHYVQVDLMTNAQYERYKKETLANKKLTISLFYMKPETKQKSDTIKYQKQGFQIHS